LGISVIVVVIEQTSGEAVEVRKLLRRGSGLWFWGWDLVVDSFDLFGDPLDRKKDLKPTMESTRPWVVGEVDG